MSELNKALSQLRQAAEQLTQEVARLDQHIAGLYAKRDALTSEPVTKADFLEYIRADLRKRAKRFAYTLRAGLKNVNKSFSSLERAKDDPAQLIHLPYLAEPGLPVDVTEAAMFFYFEDVIVAGVSRQVDAMPWPENAQTVSGRSEALAKLDAEIAALEKQRDALANELIDAGLAG